MPSVHRWLPAVLALLIALASATGTAVAQTPEPPPQLPLQLPPASPPSILAPASGEAGQIASLFYVVFWIGAGVFLLVQILIVYSVIRFRRRAADEQPRQVHGSTPLEIAWSVAPALLLIVLLGMTLRAMQNITQEPAAGALRVEVIGHQWWWEFRYPDAPAEGGQRGVVTAGELHVPVGRPVRLAISSTDVIHSYWVPQLGGKTDAIPGHVNHQNLLAGLPGEYAGQCAEFCGEQHALMRFSVVAQAPGEFETWLAGQQRRPLTDTLSGPARQGQDLFLGLAQTASGETTPCLGCHTIRGTRAVGALGPDLTHIGSRRTIVAGTLANTPENMALWLRDPQAVKPGNDMVYTTAFSAEEIRALAAFLESLK